MFVLFFLYFGIIKYYLSIYIFTSTFHNLNSPLSMSLIISYFTSIPSFIILFLSITDTADIKHSWNKTETLLYTVEKEYYS